MSPEVSLLFFKAILTILLLVWGVDAFFLPFPTLFLMVPLASNRLHSFCTPEVISQFPGNFSKAVLLFSQCYCSSSFFRWPVHSFDRVHGKITIENAKAENHLMIKFLQLAQESHACDQSRYKLLLHSVMAFLTLVDIKHCIDFCTGSQHICF